MRELGIETDAAQGREPVEAAETPEPQAPEPEPTPDTATRTSTSNRPESPEPEQVAAEKLGRDIKTGQFKKSEKPETEYSKAQKEAARKDRILAGTPSRKRAVPHGADPVGRTTAHGAA